ncbi:MAG: DUF5794 domain-containing protein [Halorientalis sp.]
MSVSQHPVALRLEQQVGEGTRLLATVMALPLLDGIFPALVLAGAIDGALGILEVGLLVFGGSATLAVVLAEMDGTRREQVTSILAVGAVVLAVAALEAAVAPTIRGLLDLATFERFAALVILAIAAKTASSRLGEFLPRPAVIIGLGLVASVDPSGASLTLVTDPMLVARGVAAAGVGVAFALSVALLGPVLRDAVDLDRFRFGSAVALGILPLSLLGLIPANAPLALAVLAVTSVLAFDPWDEPHTGHAADAAVDADPSVPDGDADSPSAAADGSGVGAGASVNVAGSLEAEPTADAVDVVPEASFDLRNSIGELNVVDADPERADFGVYGEQAPAAPGADAGGSGDDANGSDVSGSPGASDGDRAPWL